MTREVVYGQFTMQLAAFGAAIPIAFPTLPQAGGAANVRCGRTRPHVEDH